MGPIYSWVSATFQLFKLSGFMRDDPWLCCVCLSLFYVLENVFLLVTTLHGQTTAGDTLRVKYFSLFPAQWPSVSVQGSSDLEK